ncbi:hypothetical protein PDIG_01250 [Penicillium digitatum PHI26]|uniref:Uncharacterized protein n=2 Tax=Penicillium digitatum TaxID=36651 RepID=K9GYE7_PEND2|nr:hypothetical protein PDIP_12570 [Penicillium digitatum Pd1]EKV19678.1 hypothetical protein PDIG_01250 [Penicillium digitatum PHI26]EKV20790.1 hypothetical protein PDIP_12570 [Penicillium digitatum Pd1]
MILFEHPGFFDGIYIAAHSSCHIQGSPFMLSMPTNSKSSRSLCLTVTLIIPFAFIWCLYSWRKTLTLVSRPMPESSDITSTGSSASKAATPPSYSNNDNHLKKSAALLYTLPGKIWHSTKVDYLSENQREWTGSWTKKNPSFRQEMLTDRLAEVFVRALYFKTRPDIVEINEALPIPILPGDLFRYLVILTEGGM